MLYKVGFINESYRRYFKTHKKELVAAFVKCGSKGDFVLREDVEKFEINLAEYLGVRYAIGVNSGTDALGLSLEALGIGAGDEVITVSHTFIAPIQEIVRLGATPILIDVTEDGLMDVSEIEKQITARTKAILPVHLSGKVCNMPEIMALANKHKLAVVEDACQALGAKFDSKRAGTFGDTGCFSFISPKIMGGMGDAGAIVTDSPIIYQKLLLLRNHWNITQGALHGLGIKQPELMGWGHNSRLDNLQAAILNIKFKYFDWILSRRKEIAEKYLAAFEDLPLKLPTTQPEQIWQEFIIRVDDAVKFKDYMAEKGIETLVRDVVPNHKLKGLNLDHFDLPVTEAMAISAVRLPAYPELEDSEVDLIIEAVKGYYA